VITVYQVADDREGMMHVLATWNNEQAANDHRNALATTDDTYGDYFVVNSVQVNAEPSNTLDVFRGIDEWGDPLKS